MSETLTCPKCGARSGNDWSQCNGSCPMVGSPHHDPGASNAKMPMVEAALDAALGEVARQGGPDYLLKEARSEGLSAARLHLEKLVDQVVFQVLTTHDTSELWAHARRDPEIFRLAVRRGLGIA